MHHARGCQGAAERACDHRQRHHGRQRRQASLAEHALRLLRFHFRLDALVIPGAVARRHDQDLARLARRVGLGGIGSFNLGSFNLGRFELGVLGSTALRRDQIGRFDLGQGFRGFLGRRRLARRIGCVGNGRPGADGSGFAAGRLGLLFTHVRILQ